MDKSILQYKCNLTTQKINLNQDVVERTSLKMTTIGWSFKYENKSYLITPHHFLPIDTIVMDEIKLNILVNSSWADVLICELPEHIKINKSKFSNAIPKKDSKLYYISNNKKFDITCDSFEYIDFNDICSRYKQIYIKAITKPLEKAHGLSGTPVFNEDNQVIGMITKYINDKETFLILPIYCIIKNIIKKSSNNIFKIDDKFDIFKIGKYNVECIGEKRTIYNPFLKTKILLDTYYLIEGDEDKKINMTVADNKDIVSIEGEFVKENKDVYYNPNLVCNKSTLFVNARFFNLLLQLSLKKYFNLPELDKVRLEYVDEFNILQKKDKLACKDLIDIIKMNLNGFIKC